MLIYVKLLSAALLWGGTFVAGRLLTVESGPYTAAFLRFFIASLFLVVLTIRREGGLPRLSARGLVAVILLGATGVFAYNVCFFSGLKTLHAGRAAVIVATNPIFIALFAALLFKESLSFGKIVGILLSVSGAATVISHGDFPALLTHGVSGGDLAIMGCVASWVTYSLLGKRVMGVLSPLAAVTWSCITGTVMLLIPAWLEGMPATVQVLTSQAWGALFYLAVMGTVVGFVWFYEGVKTIGASKAGVFINFVPVSAVAWGFLLLAEPIDLSLALGGTLVLTGAALANRC